MELDGRGGEGGEGGCGSSGAMRLISMLGALWSDVIMKCTGVDRASNRLPLMRIGRGCFKRAKTSACSMAAENVFSLHSPRTSMSAFVKEYLPGSGAMASQLEADIVSVMLLPFGKVAEAAPAQQSSKIKTSDMERSSSVWMADHCNDGDPECRVAHQVLCLDSSILA